jgi:hypothetical protein
MVTPDFEDWLERQEIPLQNTLTAERWHQYMIDEFGFSKGSLDVVDRVYESKFQVLPEANIRPFERTYVVAGERFTETRYAITGMRGSFGAVSAYGIAQERLTAAGKTDLASIAAARQLEYIQSAPKRRAAAED